MQEKTQKTQAFEEQRHALRKQLEETRLEIAHHEAYLKVGLVPSRHVMTSIGNDQPLDDLPDITDSAPDFS